MSLKLNLCSVVLIGLHFDPKDFPGKGGGVQSSVPFAADGLPYLKRYVGIYSYVSRFEGFRENNWLRYSKAKTG